MTTVAEAAAAQVRLDGVVIGMLTGFAGDGAPLVVFPGAPSPEPAAAASIAALGPGDIGAEVALLFEAGDPRRPVVAGRLLRPGAVTVERDGGPRERLDLSAEQEITLRCGRASLTLTQAGKVLIRGTYVSSRSSGVNKIKGGSVQLN